MSKQRKDEGGLLSLVQLLARNNPDPVFLIGADEVVVWSNPAAEVRFGPEASGGTTVGGRLELSDRSEADDPAFPGAHVGRISGGAGIGQSPIRLIPLPDSDHVLAVVSARTDISDLETLAQQLSREQRERDDLDRSLKVGTYLDRQLLHRVKNNLALLGAITRYRAAATDNDAVRGELRAIHQRIGAIALVHEVLDQGRTVDILDLSKLLRELGVHLQATLCPPGMTIQTDVQPIALSVPDATPLVLLVNELVGNLLYAAGRSHGWIMIRLSQEGGDRLRVCVVLHGVEMRPLPLGPEVEALNRQLRGTLVAAADGPGWSLDFSPTRPRFGV